MSTVTTVGAGGATIVNPDESVDPKDEKDQFVKRSAYEEVTSDMHKYKQAAKDSKAKINEYESKMKALEESKMQEEAKWKELYEKRDKELQEVRQSAESEKSRYLRSVKLNALKQELGGKIKDDYLNHADLNSIEFKDDGSLSPESIQKVANKFREEHSILIPPVNVNSITNTPPANGQTVSSNEKKLSDLSQAEKIALLTRKK